ncbi:MAG: NAD-binding protein, partial [Phycisphaeraceae bacterium]
QALAAGVTLAQVGEFSFVLATAAWGREVIGESTFALIVSVTIGSLFITPYLIRYADFIGAWTERLIRPRRRRGLSVPLRRQGEEPASGQVVIVGFGPAGQAVAESLHASEQTPPMTIIDLNPRTVGSARKQGYEAFLGDAANWEVLKHARLGDARAVVVTLPDHRSAIAIIEHVRAMNPGLPVIARARYHVYVGALRIAGAQAVVDEEANVGQRLGVEVARTL